MSKILKVFLENEAGIKRHIRRFCDTPEDVSEIAQETFLRAFAASRKHEIINPRAFLYRVAKNTSIELARRKKTAGERVDSEKLDVLVDEQQPSADDILDSQRKLRLFAMAVAQLPPQCQNAFTLRHIEGLKYKQIADRMNISVSAVEKHVATALVKCRTYLMDRGYDAAELGSAKSKRQPSANDHIPDGQT